MLDNGARCELLDLAVKWTDAVWWTVVDPMIKVGSYGYVGKDVIVTKTRKEPRNPCFRKDFDIVLPQFHHFRPVNSLGHGNWESGRGASVSRSSAAAQTTISRNVWRQPGSKSMNTTHTKIKRGFTVPVN